MSEPIKIGLVGIGRAGWGMHINEIQDLGDKFKIVAACDIIESRNEKIQKRLGCRTYSSIDELLKDEEVELVDITTRSCDHYAHAVKALNAGKDVLVEKPACTSYEQFEDLLSRANKPGKPRLFFRQNRRYEVGFNELLRIADTGILGNIFEMHFLQYGYQRRDDWQTLTKYGGGQLNNWGPHLIDHALQLLNSPVKAVNSSLVHAAAGGDAEDHLVINITGENGRTATVSVSGSTAIVQGHACGRDYKLFGTKGMVIMNGYDIHLKYIDPEQELPEVISDEGTPADEFGSTGTFAAKVEPKWIEEKYELAPESDYLLQDFWLELYEAYRNNADFRIKDEEVKALMNVISKAKANGITESSNII